VRLEGDPWLADLMQRDRFFVMMSDHGIRGFAKSLGLFVSDPLLSLQYLLASLAP
jgi:hypothetical protein